MDQRFRMANLDTIIPSSLQAALNAEIERTMPIRLTPKETKYVEKFDGLHLRTRH
jgi:hypothetical protein